MHNCGAGQLTLVPADMYSYDVVSIKVGSSPFSPEIPLTAQRQLGALSITDETKSAVSFEVPPDLLIY